MIITKVKLSGKKVRLGGYGFRKYQMHQLGRVAEKSVEDRVSRGIGSSDTPMPPLVGTTKRMLKSGEIKTYLRGGYATYKKSLGKSPLRDLKFSGKMLDDFGVKYADDSKVRLDVSTRLGRVKARSNERKAPWYGLSRNDEKVVIAEAQKIFKTSIANAGVRLRGVDAPRNPIWMDPAGLKGGRLGGV